MSFAKRRLAFSFQLAGADNFASAGGGANNTALVKGLRATATLEIPMGLTAPSAQLKVFGMPLDLMNKLSTVGTNRAYGTKNAVIVQAGTISSMSTVFNGQIIEAYADLNESPDSPFTIIANSGNFMQMSTATPSSYAGAVDAAQVLADIAKQAGWQFKNLGVKGIMLTDTYTYLDSKSQIDHICAAADIDNSFTTVNADSNTPQLQLIIAPKNYVPTGDMPTISRDTGMIGYPRYAHPMISFETEFNSKLINMMGVKVESVIQQACGIWYIRKVVHQLEAESPGGAWLTRCECDNPQLRADMNHLGG